MADTRVIGSVVREAESKTAAEDAVSAELTAGRFDHGEASWEIDDDPDNGDVDFSRTQQIDPEPEAPTTA